MHLFSMTMTVLSFWMDPVTACSHAAHPFLMKKVITDMEMLKTEEIALTNSIFHANVVKYFQGLKDGN